MAEAETNTAGRRIRLSRFGKRDFDRPSRKLLKHIKTKRGLKTVIFVIETRDMLLIIFGQSGAEILSDLETSLAVMHTDYIDLYQYETDGFLPEKDSPDGIYNAFFRMKETGKIKAIGLATQELDIAEKAIYSGLYDTIQFPLSMLSADASIALVKLCEENDVGFVAMQPLCGGLVENIPLAFGFLHQYENVIPLWGVQTNEELEQILYFNEQSSHHP